MIRWEYQTITRNAVLLTTSELMEMGQQGWELVTTTVTPSLVNYIFKRPIEYNNPPIFRREEELR